MTDDLLNHIFSSQWLVLLFSIALLLAFAEAGYRLGLSFRRRHPDAATGHSGSVQGAVLGLLGLLLGFSFAMSVGRFDVRRALVVDEANSIGTTWLRADFFPSPAREELRNLLVRYAKLRLDKFATAADPESMVAIRKEVAEIHSSLWETGARAAMANPSPLTASFITSLNETIDLDANRWAALKNHVPGAVWLLVLIVAGCGTWAIGYGSGTNGFRSSFTQFVFPVLIGVVITLIVDIDSPRKGLIGINQQPMKDLLESIQPPPAR